MEGGSAAKVARGELGAPGQKQVEHFEMARAGGVVERGLILGVPGVHLHAAVEERPHEVRRAEQGRAVDGCHIAAGHGVRVGSLLEEGLGQRRTLDTHQRELERRPTVLVQEVGVGSGSDERRRKAAVLLFGCLPSAHQPVECRGPAVVASLGIGAARQKKLSEAIRPAPARDMQRRFSVLAPRIRVAPARQEKLREARAAAAHSHVKRRSALLVLGFEVRAAGEQELRDLDVRVLDPAECSQAVKRGDLLIILGVDVRAVLQEELRQLGLALLRGQMELGVAAVEGGIGICSAGEQGLDDALEVHRLAGGLAGVLADLRVAQESNRRSRRCAISVPSLPRAARGGRSSRPSARQ